MQIDAAALWVAGPRMSSTRERHGTCDPPSEDLVAVIARADRLGFSRWRVATALGLGATQLTMIEQRAGLTNAAPSPPARQHDPSR